MATLYDFQAVNIQGEEKEMSDFSGKVCLLVNVASECGLTPQYDGLQRLYSEYRGAGLEILGFPCNQFGRQEPEDEATILNFCQTQYSVDFPMFSKIDVNGDQRIPLFEWLTTQEVGPDAAGDIAWNFAKFLLDQNGKLIARYAPATEPGNASVTDRIDEALAKG